MDFQLVVDNQKVEKREKPGYTASQGVSQKQGSHLLTCVSE